jgi:high-affinity Fe2+/Pb2+ permease
VEQSDGLEVAVARLEEVPGTSGGGTMKESPWRRALAAGVALSFVLTAVAVSTADDGMRLSALISTLTICLLVTGIVVIVAWWSQRRSTRYRQR